MRRIRHSLIVFPIIKLKYYFAFKFGLHTIHFLRYYGISASTVSPCSLKQIFLSSAALSTLQLIILLLIFLKNTPARQTAGLDNPCDPSITDFQTFLFVLSKPLLITHLMEMRGLEPLTPALQRQCSPIWATSPSWFWGGPFRTRTWDLALIRGAL